MRSKIVIINCLLCCIMFFNASITLAQNLKVKDVIDFDTNINYVKVEITNHTNTKETVICKNKTQIDNFIESFKELPVYEGIEKKDYLYLEFVSDDSEYSYVSSDGIIIDSHHTDNKYYLDVDGVLKCLSDAKITNWYSLPVVDKDIEMTVSEPKEDAKTYEINILNQNGIIIGDPDGNLREGDEITRAEFSTILCRAMGCETEANTYEVKQKNYFPDVPPEHWAAGYVNFAYENKAISGFPDGNFYPEQLVTNEQVIKMLIAAWGYGEEAECNGGYPNGYMKIAKEHGILDSIEFNYANASKRWVASVFVYGVLSMLPENSEVKQPMKTEIFSLEEPREENDKYVERPEETLKNVTKESIFYERTVFEQSIPNDYLPIKIEGKTVTNVWYRDFSIAMNKYDVVKKSIDSELSVGKSLDLSDVTDGEYDIVIGYNDGKINDYSFGKLVIKGEKMYLSGRMQRYTALHDSVEFEENSKEISLSNENGDDEMPFEIKASSNGKGGYVLCINYSGSLIGEQEFRYSINDIELKEVEEYKRFLSPTATLEPIVIHDLKSGKEYSLSVMFYDKGVQKTLKGVLSFDNDNFLLIGNYRISISK